MELVLGGYAIAVATAILPMMSHQAAAKDYESLKKTLAFSVRIVAFITVPAALGLMILREPIIRVLFQHGQFVAESTRLTARALLYYAIGLPALATVKLVVPAFYSTAGYKDTGDCRFHLADHQRRAEYRLSASFSSTRAERRSRAGDGHSEFF